MRLRKPLEAEPRPADRKISVIIPALNESENILACLRSVQEQEGPHEMLVVDGGSTDGTPELARPHAQVISAPRGRAQQMNLGARLATGEVLLFLHADTRLHADSLATLRCALDDPRVAGGTFTLRFDADRRLLRFYSFCSRFRFRLFHYGDQGIFVRRSVFERLRGFADIPLMEDLDFLGRLRKSGRVALLPLPVTTSARRFEEHGVLRQQLLNTALVSAYYFGVPPASLARLYTPHKRVTASRSAVPGMSSGG
ncbi:MAG: TIGR04283 family arsenosugar biosynthesis glycosyltransferase [Acidobacteria bacterium]|nr:TIGR04283 family arsenosugar biosynthesis glycosyltransferase [Acidobacteriota bacterium]